MKTNEVLTSLQENELEVIGELYREAIYSQNNVPNILDKLISSLEDQRGEISQTIIAELVRYRYVIRNRDFFATLRDWISELYDILKNLLPDNLSFTIECRRKSVQSTIRKILTNYLEGKSIDLFDLVAFRIVIDSPDSKEQQITYCYTIKTACISFFKSKFCTLCRPIISIGTDDLVKDYIAVPKENGYQSIHLAFRTVENNVIEVQIRTLDMHEHAEIGNAKWQDYKDSRYFAIQNIICFDVEKVDIPLFRKLNNGSIFDKVGLVHALHIEQRSKTF